MAPPSSFTVSVKDTVPEAWRPASVIAPVIMSPLRCCRSRSMPDVTEAGLSVPSAPSLSLASTLSVTGVFRGVRRTVVSPPVAPYVDDRRP